MRIVFMGTPHFAVPSLKALAAAHDVCAVVTAPDKPAGRGMKLVSSPVKDTAMALGIPVLQPDKLKSTAFVDELSALQANLFAVVAFRMLPEVIWAMPLKGTINLHASLLPAYRGAAPINRAIMNGEKITGLTTFFIEKEIDTGKVIAQTEMEIGPDETAGELHDRMMVSGAQLLLDTVNAIAHDEAQGIDQESLIVKKELPTAPKIFKEDCQINWHLAALQVHNHIRGLSPYPGAHTLLVANEGETMTFKIFGSQLCNEPLPDRTPGSIHQRNKRLIVACGSGALAITDLQIPGKRRMRIEEFLNGFQVTDRMHFSG